jgi:hypothetical protein
MVPRRPPGQCGDSRPRLSFERSSKALSTNAGLLSCQFRRSQKIVVARRIQPDIPYPPRMH